MVVFIGKLFKMGRIVVDADHVQFQLERTVDAVKQHDGHADHRTAARLGLFIVRAQRILQVASGHSAVLGLVEFGEGDLEQDVLFVVQNTPKKQQKT